MKRANRRRATVVEQKQSFSVDFVHSNRLQAFFIGLAVVELV